jgi:hypothetical protein
MRSGMKEFWGAVCFIGLPPVLAACGGLAWLGLLESAAGLRPTPPDALKHVRVPVKMRLFASPCKINRPFSLSLFIRGGEPGAQVFLHVPSGLELADEESTARILPPPGPAGYAQITWRLIPRQQGRFMLEVHGPDGSLALHRVAVRGPPGYFDE